MPFDIAALKLQRERQCLAFSSVLHEAHLISTDLSYLLAKDTPPASKSSITTLEKLQTSIKAISLPTECVKLICDFAFKVDATLMLRECIMEQHRKYSRLPGKIVFNSEAKVGERVRESRWPSHWYGYESILSSKGKLRSGIITSLDCDHNSEVAVEWDDGTKYGNTLAGIKCGKKGKYGLVYD